jgi:hypothetical protein
VKAVRKKTMRGPDSPARGPEPERLKLNMSWQTAVKKSFQKKRPVNDWPKIAD